MKILLIHPDSPNNRGDRAILAGSIALIKQTWPHAEIWAFSENLDRDREWLGVNFVSIPVQSIDPVNQLRLMKLARQCDLVLWGGGEILKDYTNKFALWYWVIKMYLVTLANQNLYGFFQGIGPTSAPSSKKVIAFIVNRTKVFFVRDNESKEKLVAWGAKTVVVGSFDTAVIAQPKPWSKQLAQKLAGTYGIEESFLKNSFGVAPKAWFHYKQGGLIPYKYRHKLSGKTSVSSKTDAMYTNLAELVDRTIEKYDMNALFFPMHLSRGEGDPASAREVIARMKHKERTKVVDKDLLSPDEFITTIGQVRFLIGVRLHATILASIAKTPALVFYYVDKGRLFFEQLGMQNQSHPVEDLLNEELLPVFEKKIEKLVTNRSSIQKGLTVRVDTMRKSITKDFSTYMDDHFKRG